jgi:hypothetical protein
MKRRRRRNEDVGAAGAEPSRLQPVFSPSLRRSLASRPSAAAAPAATQVAASPSPAFGRSEPVPSGPWHYPARLDPLVGRPHYGSGGGS